VQKLDKVTHPRPLREQRKGISSGGERGEEERACRLAKKGKEPMGEGERI